MYNSHIVHQVVLNHLHNNLHFLLKLMEDIRQAIREDRLLDFKDEFFEQYGLNYE
jgi:queuine tRNA-ribosyltransferase